MTKVLVANVPEGDARIRECLAQHDLVYVRTMRDAVRALEDWLFDLVVIGLHFDESRMFELLLHIRLMRGECDIGTVCVQTQDSAMSDGIRTNIEVAAMALGATAFLDLRDGPALAQQREILRQIPGVLKNR